MRKIAFGIVAISFMASISAAYAIGGQPHLNGNSNDFFPGIDRQVQPYSGYPMSPGYNALAPDRMDRGVVGHRDDDNR
jgi:hypothetical protein